LVRVIDCSKKLKMGKWGMLDDTALGCSDAKTELSGME
jgi:hypothetical protein